MVDEDPPALDRPTEEFQDAQSRGWDALGELIPPGITSDAIPSLIGAHELEPLYPLLHALIGRSPRDFFVRVAALEALVTDGRAAFLSRDLEEILYWLNDAARDSMLRTLRANGWLDYDPSIGTTITDAGRWAYEILGFLHKRLRENEFRPTLAGVEYALQIGVDPLRHLESLRSRLNALHHDIEVARASHSEVVLRKAVAKLDETLGLSQYIRQVLDRVPRDNRAARRTVREIHDLLSRLHGVSANLHAVITEVGRQFLRLTAGMTVEQIVRALMRRSREELAAVGREALLPVFTPPPLLNTEVVAVAAEQQVLRERHAKEPVIWEEPPEPRRVEDASLVPLEVKAFLADLAEIAHAGKPVPLDAAVPRGTAGESFLRASLLPLAGDQRAGEGVAGQLGALPIEIETEDEGWPQPLNGASIKELTPGCVRPREVKPGKEAR